MLNADFRLNLVTKYTLKVFSWSLFLTIRLIYQDTSPSSKAREVTANLLAGEKILIAKQSVPVAIFCCSPLGFRDFSRVGFLPCYLSNLRLLLVYSKLRATGLGRFQCPSNRKSCGPSW